MGLKKREEETNERNGRVSDRRSSAQDHSQLLPCFRVLFTFYKVLCSSGSAALLHRVMLYAHARSVGPLACYEGGISGVMLLPTVGCAALSVTG